MWTKASTAACRTSANWLAALTGVTHGLMYQIKNIYTLVPWTRQACEKNAFAAAALRRWLTINGPHVDRLLASRLQSPSSAAFLAGTLLDMNPGERSGPEAACITFANIRSEAATPECHSGSAPAAVKSAMPARTRRLSIACAPTTRPPWRSGSPTIYPSLLRSARCPRMRSQRPHVGPGFASGNSVPLPCAG